MYSIYNGKRYKLKIGEKGGRYIIVNKKKHYITPKKGSGLMSFLMGKKDKVVFLCHTGCRETGMDLNGPVIMRWLYAFLYSNTGIEVVQNDQSDYGVKWYEKIPKGAEGLPIVNFLFPDLDRPLVSGGPESERRARAKDPVNVRALESTLSDITNNGPIIICFMNHYPDPDLTYEVPSVEYKSVTSKYNVRHVHPYSTQQLGGDLGDYYEEMMEIIDIIQETVSTPTPLPVQKLAQVPKSSDVKPVEPVQAPKVSQQPQQNAKKEEIVDFLKTTLALVQANQPTKCATVTPSPPSGGARCTNKKKR